jgi:hypothetical protein
LQVLNYTTAIEPDYRITDSPCFIQIVGDQNGGDSRRMDNFTDEHTKFNADFFMESGQWLVQKDEIGVTGQTASKGNTLALPTRKRSRLAVSQLPSTDLFKEVMRLCALCLPPTVMTDRQGYVREHSAMWEQQSILEDHANVTILCSYVDSFVRIEDRSAGQRYHPRIGLAEASNHRQGHRLSGRGRPQEYGDPRLDCEYGGDGDISDALHDVYRQCRTGVARILRSQSHHPVREAR